MRKSTTRRSLIVIALMLLPALFLSPSLTNAQATKVVAKKAQNQTLNKVILTTTKGHTLYSLSVEKNGKFICTGACTKLWHPLVISANVKPKGPVKLGTVKRPDGRTQVTYQGRPLYSFSGDSKKGDVKGEGFKDVGTWHAARIGNLPMSQPQPSPPPENPYPY